LPPLGLPLVIWSAVLHAQHLEQAAHVLLRHDVSVAVLPRTLRHALGRRAQAETELLQSNDALLKYARPFNGISRQ
jgi:hypothetical protein